MDTDFYRLTTPELNLEAKDARCFSRAKATLMNSYCATTGYKVVRGVYLAVQPNITYI